MSRPHGQMFPIERLDDLGGKDCLELFGVRVRVPEIPEHVTAAPRHFQLFVFHRNNTPGPSPCMGFAMSALPPSAAMVSAVRQIVLARSGNVLNSLSAALIHETGRFSRHLLSSPG